MAACNKAACKADDKKDQEDYDDGMAPAARMDAIKGIFIKADKDGNKLISLDEWLECAKENDGDKYDKAAATKEFKGIDVSNSGDISLAELDLFVLNLQMEQVAQKFKAADSSKDRKLDKKEFFTFFGNEGMKKRAIKKLWAKCDINKDGKVSYTEFRDFMTREMADGCLQKTFADMFEEDPRKNKEAIKAKAAKAKADKAAKKK